MKSLVAGVDIGGTHITTALIDMQNGSMLANSLCRERVDAKAGAEDIISTWANNIGNCFTAAGQLPGYIGIAMPGPFNYSEGIALMKDQGKYDALYGRNVRQMMAEKLNVNKESILFNNDATCFLQGELFNDDAKNVGKVIGLTLGTGLGSAIADSGKVADMNLWSSPFKGGVAEDYLSGKGLVKKYVQLSNRSVENVKALAILAEHDADAQQVFVQFGIELGELLEPIIKNNKIELVVLGGSISKAFRFFSTPLRRCLEKHKVAITESILGEQAALIGAASMWQHIKADGGRLQSI